MSILARLFPWLFKKDLGASPRLKLDWSAGKGAESINALFDHAMSQAESSINWYISAKRPKKFYASSCRVLAIILGAVAGFLPLLGEMFKPENGRPLFHAGWTAILLGVAGALVLTDRVFGFSTAWMRYISTELQLRQIADEFQIDWEAEKAAWQGQEPSPEQVTQMLARCKAFVTQINTIVRDETNVWIQEFENTIKIIDESVKAKSAVSEPGALNLTVTNGDAAAGGWSLSIDGATAETYTGKTAGKRNLVPGRHEIKVVGTINGQNVQAERVISVPAGGTCAETLTLS